jgi:hypothetical protein
MPRDGIVKAFAAVLLAATTAASAHAQRDSLVNTQIFPRNTPVVQVRGQMRNIAFALGVECTYCHVGPDNAPLAQVDFASDAKRTKLVARQMLRMVQEINRRVDTIPGRSAPMVAVTCATCHRGLARPVPLVNVITETAIATSADSALATYNGLRATYYGRDAYDFGEPTLSVAAFRVARAGKIDDAFKLLDVNERQFPNSSAISVIRGNIHLMVRDTANAAAAFNEALRRDSANDEARGRLRDIGRQP